MNDRPDSRARRLVRGLGLTSIALGVAPVLAPERLARTMGVDDHARAAGLVRAVGVREVVQGVVLLAAPARAVWLRLLGDAMDLAMLGSVLGGRRGDRDRRTSGALAAVLGITALDVYAAARASRDDQHGRGRPGPLQLRASTTVNRSPQEVYAFWRDLENLPRFMLHVKSVADLGEGRSLWKANAPIRKAVAWEAEITGDEPGRRISWKSLPGADVDNSGTVHFTPAPDGKGTEVSVTLHYDVPGGAIGRVLAKLLGEEPEQQVRDDLRRFKQVMETGDIVRTETLPHGTEARRQFLQRPGHAAKGRAR